MVFFSLVLAIRHDHWASWGLCQTSVRSPITSWAQGYHLGFRNLRNWGWVEVGMFTGLHKWSQSPWRSGSQWLTCHLCSLHGCSGFWVEWPSMQFLTWHLEPHFSVWRCWLALEVSQGPAFRSFKIEVFLEMSQQKLTININNCIKLCEILSSVLGENRFGLGILGSLFWIKIHFWMDTLNFSKETKAATDHIAIPLYTIFRGNHCHPV